MTNQELFELMDRFSASGLTGLRLTQKDVSLELTRNGGPRRPPQPRPALRRGRNRRGRSCPHRWWVPITPPLRRTPSPS